MSLEVPAAALVCVMGRNGVGKTTLMHAIMGILTPRAGRVRPRRLGVLPAEVGDRDTTVMILEG